MSVERLLSTAGSTTEEQPNYSSNRRRGWSTPIRTWILTICVPFFVSVATVFLILNSRRASSALTFADTHYSKVPTLEYGKYTPAHSDALQYEIVQPKEYAWESSVYAMKPSQKSDIAWNSLQQVRAIWISSDEASSLNISGLHAENERTVTVLGIMHNVHCLRYLRQMLYPEIYYPNSTADEHGERLDHAGHCIEAIRQSVTCLPDLTPHPVLWENEKEKKVYAKSNVPKECVSWSSLLAWEESRKINSVNQLQV